MKSIIALLKEKITQYIDVYIKLAKISFIEGTANILSYFMFAFIILFIVFCLMFFLGLGISEAFVCLGLSRVLAIFITFGIYIILLFGTLMLRRRITGFFAGGFINLMTGSNDRKQKNEEEDD